uniref:Uncharacterized protein n=1 Tax=Parascaris univalens TaxID=6257 RepID=A0A915AE54_PARUN
GDHSQRFRRLFSMETIVTDWAGGRKARVLSRSLTGSALAAAPSRTEIDPNILKHVRRTKPQRSSSSSSNPLPYSSDGSLPAHLRFRHLSHESIIHVKPAPSMGGTCSCSELKCKEQDYDKKVLQSNHVQSVEAGLCEWSRVRRCDKSVTSSRNPPYYRVLEFLSCGSIEAATNGHIICSNKI